MGGGTAREAAGPARDFDAFETEATADPERGREVVK